MGHWDRSRFGGEELWVIWICRIGQDPLPASRSCHGNHEGKEGMEWKVSRVPDGLWVAAHQPNINFLIFNFHLSSV
jgi:hypothetical protein